MDEQLLQVTTTRFGTVTIDARRVITFRRGLLGFPSSTRFCLLDPEGEGGFYWLQSLDDPALAFVVTDPGLYEPEYAVPIRSEQMQDLSMTRLDEAQVFVIVNRVGSTVTGNLLGPLVVNTAKKLGSQFILAEKRWQTRHELARIEPAAVDVLPMQHRRAVSA
jgi:flagellar assembly factor FliW